MADKWKVINEKWKIQRGFTLVELLVVISIIGVLVTITLVSFRSSQARARDAQRKSDLKEIGSSLELFLSDYGKYPDANAGRIVACPYTATPRACTWGSDEFWDLKTTYFKVLPKDPASGQNYYYRIVDPGTNEKFQLFAHLENTQDPNCIYDSLGKPNCVAPAGIPAGATCGSGICNFATTSTNAKPTD